MKRDVREFVLPGICLLDWFGHSYVFVPKVSAGVSWGYDDPA